MNMAKRKYSKMRKIEPSELTLSFVTPTVPAGTAGNFYIDLSQCASLVNRRFYRQGINWAVSGIKIFSGVNASVGCRRLPNSWVMSNAWEKSFRAWQQMIKNATDESGSESIKGKFLDFKIYADAEHHRQGSNANLLPFTIDSTGAQLVYTRGEWDKSSVFIPGIGTGAAQEFELIAVGANDPGVSPATGLNAKSVVQGYADSRALPSITDPNVPDDAPTNWMLALFNDGTIQDGAVVQDLLTQGDQPPYPFENDGTNLDTMYPGGETQASNLVTHDFDTITGTTIGSMTRMKGGNFPCGLMNFLVVPESTSGITIQIDLVPGTHRGYLCEPMTEM